MSTIPEINTSDILHRVGSASYKRSHAYVGNGLIYNTRRIGSTLKARCQGNMPDPYYVEVTFNKSGIGEADCSCPVGDGGYCKHVAALLRMWIDDPGLFVEMEDLDTTLENRTREELILIIQTMLARYPDLESVVMLAAATGTASTSSNSGTQSASTIETAFFENQIQEIINQRRYDEWHSGYDIARQLNNLMVMATKLESKTDPMKAMRLYQTMAWALLDQYQYLYDDDGDISMVVSYCVDKLRTGLPDLQNPDDRKEVLESLFNIYKWDINFGGIGISDEVPEILVSETTPEERQLITEWTEKALRGVKASDNWESKQYGELLLDLQLDQLDDEAFINICRETGRTYDLVDRLLALNRLDEALQVAEQASDYELLTLADLFLDQGASPQIADVIRRRITDKADHSLLIWLRDYVALAGETEEALTLSIKVFARSHTVNAYEQILTHAEKLGKEDSVRANLLRQLEDQELFDLLTQIYLFENHIEDAIRTVWRKPQKKQLISYFMSHTPGLYLKTSVAEAAEADYPLKAVELHLHIADTLIDKRGRDNYAEAANHLKRIRAIYQQTNAESTWNELIKEIRTSYKRLYALQDELKKAGL